MPRYLIKYEIRQIQKYIYASSKIKEIVGASKIVRDCLIDFLIEACDEMNLKHNIKKEYGKLNLAFKFDDSLDFQIGFEGGGNLACFFKGDEEKVKEFNRRIGFLFLKKTYSLRVCYAYVEVTDNFQNDRKKLDEKLSKVKVTMPMTNLQGTIPVVMSSTESSLPLSEVEKNGKRRKITRESALKLKKYSSDFDTSNGNTCIDEFIEKNIDSYIAIIHIDANDLGTAITSYFKNNEKETYEDNVDLSRQVSVRIKTKFNDEFDKYLKSFIESKGSNKIQYRIIVNSGDDITLIMSNNYAIELVTGFLERINENSFFDNEIKISACAGIAFVKSHFPYDRGYEIAEELCESAKKKAKSEKIRRENNNQSRCAFDYYICQNGIITTVEEDESKEKLKDLYCKPYIVNRNTDAMDDCETLFKRLKELNDESNGMSIGKAKQIRNAYEKNKQTTEMLFKKISSRLKNPLDDPFENSKATYYDASTLIDFVDMPSKKGK